METSYRKGWMEQCENLGHGAASVKASAHPTGALRWDDPPEWPQIEDQGVGSSHPSVGDDGLRLSREGHDLGRGRCLKRADGGELPAYSFPAAGGEACTLKGGLARAASTGRASASTQGHSEHPGSQTRET